MKNITVMKQYIKYFCAFLIMLGTSAHTFGEGVNLPFSYDGGRNGEGDPQTIPSGMTISGLDADYASSPKMKFKDQGSYVLIHLADAPGTLSYKIKGASFSGGTFKVLQSVDDAVYTDVAVYTSLGDVSTEVKSLSPNTRYIKFIYTTKSSGNVGLGAISISLAPTYDVEWHVGETTAKSQTGVASSTPPVVSDGALGGDCSSLKFVGWTATEIGATPTTAPADLFNGEVTLTGDAVYYAVFAEQLTPASETNVFSDNLNISGTGVVSSRSGWSSLNLYCYGGQGSLRLSSSSSAGIATTSALSSLTSAAATITFKIKAWGASESGLVTLSASSGTLGKTEFTAPYETYPNFSEVSTTLTGGSSSTTLTFTGNKDHRIYIKDLSIVLHTPATYETNSYRTLCACTNDPTVGNASVESSFTLTSLTGAVNVYSGLCSPGSGCEWTDFGLTWGTSSTPTGNKKTVASSGTSTSFDNSIQPSGSTSPTSWTVGTQYYVCTYGKNGKAGAEYVYGTATSFILRSITFNPNGGSSVGPWYVKSGGTYSAPTAPTKTGYDFAGWYTDNETFEFPVDWTAAVSENKTYYAKWTAKDISIALHKNNSDASGSSDGSASVKYDATFLTNISHATRTDYSLEGYYAEAGCTHKVLTAEGALVNYSGYVENGKWVRNSATDLYANWTAVSYTDYKFNCAELTLTPKLVTENTPIFITATAGQTVRSLDSILVVGSGLTPNTDLAFPGLPSTFAVKSNQNATLRTDASGDINAVACIYYTPDGSSINDGLDEIAGITVRVDGAKAKQVTLSQSIIGRHLPANIVIAGEYNGVWYALPSTMSGTTHPEPVLIAVDNATTPTTAYTSTDNAYALYGQTNAMMNAGVGGYVKLAMKGLSDAPLFGDATGNTQIGKSGQAIITNDLSKGWWWQLRQTNTSITTAADAKYKIYCQNNSSSLSIKENPTQWGLYASGTEELRLLTLEVVTPITASVTEWGKNSAIFDVNPKVGDNLANKVVAYLGEATSGVKDVKETKTSGGNASKYNYTVNFGSDIDFSAAASEGATLRLVWKKDETEIGSSVIVIPKVFATDANLHDIDGYKTHWEKKEVHVLPGNTLTIDAGNFENKGVTVGHLEIYPGATVKVTKGAAADGTLTATNLVLRYGWTRAGEKAYDVARLYVTPSTATLKATNVYADWYIDYDQYYPIGVPWEVTVSSISYHNTSASPSVGPNGQVRLRYYDGANRTSTGQSDIGKNWKEYGAAGNTAVPTTLKPSMGYAMTAKRPTGKAFSVVRMPLSLPSGTWSDGTWTTEGEKGSVGAVHKDQVTTFTYSEGSTPWYALGWNFIANPYMCTFNGDDDGIKGGLVDQQGKGTKYVTIPTEDFANYYQTNIEDADLKPASGFFVQAASNTTITFDNSNIEPSSAPAKYMKAEETMPEQQVNIRLSYEGGKDQMGLLIADNYTAEYEINADLAKILGDGNYVRTYMNYGGMDMAYLAINPTLAQEWIPVTVNVPVDGEYTFSLTNSSVVEALEGIYLVDYAEDNKVVNLIDDNYTFYATAGTFTDRFSINAIVGERETPTGVDAVNSGVIESDKPIKFLFHEKVYILYHGIIYDATGKKVREINK